jgi:hypothetical protein
VLRKAQRVALAVTIFALPLIADAPSAHAQNCPLTDHCYSIITYSGTTVYYGGYFSTRANFMTPGEGSTGPAFITSEMWVLQGLNGPNWVEVGLTNGPINGGGPGYQSFWADFRQSSSTPYQERTIEYMVPDGRSINFQITRSGTVNRWGVRQNGALMATSRSVDFWQTQRVDIGGELASTNTNARADTFAMTGRIFNSAGQALNFPGTRQTVDFPCPQAGCFNGVWYSSLSRWDWNKQQG